MKTRRSVLLNLLFGLTALGCAKSPATNEVKDHNLKSRAVSEQATLAQGYDVQKQRFQAGKCLEATEETVGINEATTNFDRSMTKGEMMSSFGFDAGGRYNFGVGSVSAGASFARESTSTSYSETVIYSSTYRFKSRQLDIKNPLLTDIGKIALGRDTVRKSPGQADNTVQFRTVCGDEFVSQVELGAALFFSVKLDFATEEDKSSFNAHFNLNAPFVSVSSTLDQASRNYGSSATVTFRAYQLGGNVSRLSTIFDNSNGQQGVDANGQPAKEAYAIVSCSLDNLAACNKVLDAAINYSANRSEENAFPQQLKFDSITDATRGPAVLAYITKPYSDVGIIGNPPIVDASLAADRATLENVFNKTLAYASRTQSILSRPFRLSMEQRKRFQEIDGTLETIRGKILSAVSACYENLNFLDCHNMTASANGDFLEVNQNYFEKVQDLFDIKPEIFTQYCDRAYLPIYSKKLRDTIVAMIEKGKEDLGDLKDTDDVCRLVGQELEKMTELSLTGKKITDLEPLRTLPNLTKLVLRENSIKELNWLSKMTNLKELDLSYNDIENVQPLGGLTGLYSLKLHGNPLGDFSPVDKLANLSTYYRKAAEICVPERAKLLDMRRMTQTDYDFFSKIDYGPVYEVHGDRKSKILEWKPCVDAARSI